MLASTLVHVLQLATHIHRLALLLKLNEEGKVCHPYTIEQMLKRTLQTLIYENINYVGNIIVNMSVLA